VSVGTILVAGIGNIFLGDDGFGVEVARQLTSRPHAESVRIADFGIRGFDLAFAILDDPAATILIDFPGQKVLFGDAAAGAKSTVQLRMSSDNSNRFWRP